MTISPPAPLAPDLASAWLLDPQIDFLNHGSFGARLRQVFEAQLAHMQRFEARPVEVLDRRGPELLAEARAVLGAFLGMEPDDFGFTSNATDAVSAVLGSLRFEPGDEVMTTSHVYNGVRQATRTALARVGASLREIEVPVPCTPESVRTAVREALSDATRLVILSHVTSPTALRFPVAEIAADLRARGVRLLVDGAHAPGMLDLDVQGLGVDYYAANLHKWLSAPTGAGLLWVRRELQEGVHPLVVSHNVGRGLASEFTWQGTRDVSPWLAAADAVRIGGEIVGPDSWPRVRRHNHELATWVQATLAERWQVEPISALDGSMLGSMASLRIPQGVRARFSSPAELQASLYDEHRFEVPCFEWQGLWLVRPCCHVYNRAAQYERLGDVVLGLAA